jgi:hypothetical protein
MVWLTSLCIVDIHTSPEVGHWTWKAEQKRRDRNTGRTKATRLGARSGTRNHVPEVRQFRDISFYYLESDQARSVSAQGVHLRTVGRCQREVDFALNISHSQNYPGIEWTPLGVVMSSPLLGIFKHRVKCHLAVTLQRWWADGREI